MENNFDFCGWATKNDLVCADGRIIRRDAFKHHDGQTVPLVWNHDRDDPYRVVGHALLENREEGVYTYGYFNDSDLGKTAKIYVQHGDINQLSIYANKLKQHGNDVMHGVIREVSLVLAGANPGACIENVIKHGEEFDDEARIWTGEEIELYHADSDDKEDTKVAETKKPEGEKTVGDVFETLTEEQKIAVYAIIGQVAKDMEEKESEVEHSDYDEGDDDVMKHNVFDNTETAKKTNVLSHADQEEIISLAKQSNVGSLKMAMDIYAAEHADTLQHGFEDYEELFPEYELLKKGAPELLERDQSWISYVLNKIHKSPISRVRTRYADARIAELKALGYQQKGDKKKITAKINLIGRRVDPQTVYIKDEMHRDDIIDITDFDTVAYNWTVMRHTLNETLALAALVGDGRDEADADKIHENHIVPVWNDDEEYTIHSLVDIEAAREELNGNRTGEFFGENYIYAEAIITAALYAREQYKGSGSLDMFCTPHMLNVMLLARDLNGRRIYNSASDLAAALNVKAIHTIEQFEGLVRTDDDERQRKLLALFVNMGDYQFGATKGGEVTRFEDFDMDFNKYKYMLETRLSGALTKLKSAIALEELVPATDAGAGTEPEGEDTV